MPFIDIKELPALELQPGVRLRTPYGKNLMLSYLEIEEGATVPLHNHPHEQGGIVLEGKLKMTIGNQTRVCEAGSMFLVPPNVYHKAVAVGGPVRALGHFQSGPGGLRQAVQYLCRRRRRRDRLGRISRER